MHYFSLSFFFFQAEDGIRDVAVTGVQTCALPISSERSRSSIEESAMRSHLIAGQWTAGKQSNADINPSDTSDVIDQYASGDAAAVDAAVAAARAAFPAWSVSTPQQRFDALDFAGSEILARRAELGELLAREEGKTLPEATGEAARAGQIFKFFAGEALRTAGEIIPSIRPGMSVEVTREPIGVVGLITPWNFPIAIPAWKIAPALDRKSTRLNSSHGYISYAVFCLKKKTSYL